MKAEVKIPRGWRKVPVGAKPKIGDSSLRLDGRGVLCWSVLRNSGDCEVPVSKNELVIRRIVRRK